MLLLWNERRAYFGTVETVREWGISASIQDPLFQEEDNNHRYQFDHDEYVFLKDLFQ